MFTLFDALDIALVTILIYQAYRLVVNSRTLNLLRGLLVFGLLLYVSRLLGLSTINFILSQLATVGLFALIVVFQPELRSLLERLGRPTQREDAPQVLALNEIARAVERLADRFGASDAAGRLRGQRRETGRERHQPDARDDLRPQHAAARRRCDRATRADSGGWLLVSVAAGSQRGAAVVRHASPRGAGFIGTERRADCGRLRGAR